MGRLKRRSKRKKPNSKRNNKAHESDPDRPRAETRENSPNTAWSCDEEALADYVHNVRVASDGSDEMEVTKRLSSLNFDVIPCSMDPANFVCRRETGLALEHYAKEGVGHHAFGDVCSFSEELYTSATNLDVLPGVEELDNHLTSRQARKRSSRRRPNKKVKKLKGSYTSPGFVHSQKMKRAFISPSRYRSSVATQGSHVYNPHSNCLSTSAVQLHRVRNMEVDDDNMCVISNASAVCDVDMLPDCSGEMSECTPSSFLSGRGLDSPGADVDPYGAASDHSETTTTDSGCEGDDEESSVEGPSHLRLPGWWDKEPNFSSSPDEEEEEKFTQILNASFPLMSKEGRDTFEGQLILPEFKHPGKFGIRGSVRKKKGKPANTGSYLTPKEIDQKIAAFVQSNEFELCFQLVSRVMCRTISRLAVAYKLGCVVEQRRPLPVVSPILRRTAHTALASRAEVEPILKNHGRESPIVFKQVNVTAVQPRRESQLVGGKAPVLDNSNRGNKILQGMGWIPGTGLGPNGTGIVEPVTAYIRPRHMGLGY